MTLNSSDFKKSVNKLLQSNDIIQEYKRGKVDPELLESWKNKVTYLKSFYDTSEKGKSFPTLDDFNLFVNTYFSQYTRDRYNQNIPLPKFHLDAIDHVVNNKKCFCCFEFARGHAKSTVMGLFLPIYLSLKGEVKNIVYVSKSSNDAIAHLQQIQVEFQYNKLLIRDFGDFKTSGDWSKSKFITNNGVCFNALGRGQSPRGLIHKNFRPDLIIVDDIDDDVLSRNKDRVEETYEWMIQALLPTLDPNYARFIMIGNRFATNMVLTKFIEIPTIHHVKINAFDENGEPSWKELWSKESLEERKTIMGTIRFTREYMNTPIDVGSIFKSEWIKYTKIKKLSEYKYIVSYFDPSFSNTGDYKAVATLGFIDNEFHIIDIYCRKGTIKSVLYYLFELYNKLETDKARYSLFFEGLFAQEILYIEEIRKLEIELGYKIPIISDKDNKSDKISRIESITPWFERGEVYWNVEKEIEPDFKKALEQLLGFGYKSRINDDYPDSLASAFSKLNKMIRNMNDNIRIGKHINHHSF